MSEVIQSEQFLVGSILAEFLDAWDAQQFRILKGKDRCAITAGINLPFAVRELRKVVEVRDESH